MQRHQHRLYSYHGDTSDWCKEDHKSVVDSRLPALCQSSEFYFTSITVQTCHFYSCVGHLQSAFLTSAVCALLDLSTVWF